MTLEERAALAAEWRKKLHNCCAGVAMALADQTELTQEQMRMLSSGFAGGIGGMTDGSCGALVGAVMAAGMHKRGEGTMPAARQISALFRERCGSTICREIKGIGTGTVLCRCEDCVDNAVRIYCEVVGTDDD